MVLIVEDQYLLAVELRQQVERLGATVIGPAPNTAQALRLLAGRAPDAALLDIHLQNETVYEVAEQLQSRNIPFFFLTGYDRSSLDPRFLDHPHFEKPVAEKTLLSALTPLLG